MNLNALKKFAQAARRQLMTDVTARVDYVTGHDDGYVRAHRSEIADLRRQIEAKGRSQVIEEVAYTWFNRIIALRYMDLRGYHRPRIVSPQVGQVQPELLFEIKQGRTPRVLEPLRDLFDRYLNGRVATDQPDREVYTAALLGICNDYSRTLPFLFRQVDAYMAVLLPTDLLSESSILSAVQGAIGEEDVADVEVIGWLYQFYISEKKDQVFGRPKGEKIKKEDIPAATQLFTPHWIVRYMVENSLGRLWRNNRPDTALSERMEYYIEGDPEPEYLTIEGPEEITLLDPACGSGHILTYAFDLLYGMYEEAGYSAEEIPSLILTNNLYGIDIDTRAAELASFALTMKAREKDRFFFKRGVVPRVVAMEDVSVDLREAGITMSPHLQEAFGYLTEATNFGSLIPVPAEVQGEIEDILADLDARGDADLFADQAMAQVRSGLRQLGYLARRYHCVVTNPPYLANKNMNSRLGLMVREKYPVAKGDLCVVFIDRAQGLCATAGLFGLITMQSWMFLSSFEEFRKETIRQTVLASLVHLGEHAFDTIGGAVVSTAAAVWINRALPFRSVFVRLVSGPDESSKRSLLLNAARSNMSYRYDRYARDILEIPGVPFAYWLDLELFAAIRDFPKIGSVLDSKQGLATANNDRFLRRWFEVDTSHIGFNLHNTDEATSSRKKWFPLNKGGDFRRWYGNHEYVVNWEDDGAEIKEFVDKRYPYLNGNIDYVIKDRGRFFQESISWSDVASRRNVFRYYPHGFLYEAKGHSAFFDSKTERDIALGYLNSKVASLLIEAISPTVSFHIGYFDRLPWPSQVSSDSIAKLVERAIELSRLDWDSRELSWNFKRNALLLTINQSDKVMPTMKQCLERYEQSASQAFMELKAIEESLNEVFLKEFDLEAKYDPKIDFSEVSIVHPELDQERLVEGSIVASRLEIIRQLISYGVGCIFGRYSLDKDGIILASAGDDLAAYLSQIPDPTLRPDESGILPITDDNDFSDDLPSQWQAFLRGAFGDEQYEGNLRFLEDGLGKRLRQYFLKGFYDDHVKRYKKRPIYWLITSPKGTLQALIYLHRYNRDTVNRFLNDYLRPYQQKLEAKRVSAEHVLTGGGSSQSEKTKAQKRIDEIRKALEELSTWERDVVRPLAEKRIELDLDDGVKVNYGKLGAILAKVKGLNA